jgi:hypothetical protein
MGCVINYENLKIKMKKKLNKTKFHIRCGIHLFHDIEFLRRPRPSPEG